VIAKCTTQTTEVIMQTFMSNYDKMYDHVDSIIR